MKDAQTPIARAFLQNQAGILETWTDAQLADPRVRGGRIDRSELTRQSGAVLAALGAALAESGPTDVRASAYEPVREVLAEIALLRERQGFEPMETAAAIIMLKDYWLPHLEAGEQADPEARVRDFVTVARLVDTLGLWTFDALVRRRESIISQQAQEIIEVATPVVQVWDGVVAAPLIGSLDSRRTQQFMERLLHRVVETNSPVALVDITGVPTIDTQTAQHLVEAVSAVRLLGAQVVLTGVRPQIAQTLVHLGIDLSDVVTRSSLASGLQVAFRLLNIQVSSANGSAHA